MLKSLKIINNYIKYYENILNDVYKSNAENGYYDELDIFLYQNKLKEFQQIKKDLEILHLIIKWKNNFTFCYDVDYLDNEEIEKFKSEIILVENYIHHHFGYIPKFFNKVGDNQ